MLHALSHFFGLDNLSGPFYGFWSGAGSDITELAIVGGLVSIWRRHSCHVHGCWRFGHFSAGEYIVCRKHHPGMDDSSKVTQETVNESVRQEALK